MSGSPFSLWACSPSHALALEICHHWSWKQTYRCATRPVSLVLGLFVVVRSGLWLRSSGWPDYNMGDLIIWCEGSLLYLIGLE